MWAQSSRMPRISEALFERTLTGARLASFGGSIRSKLLVRVPSIGRVSTASGRAALRRLTMSLS